MSRPAEWSKRAQMKRNLEWFEIAEEPEEEPEVLPPELSTPWPMPDPYHGDAYHTMPGFGPRSKRK